MAQEITKNFKEFNIKAETTLESTLKEAKQEVKSTTVSSGDDSDTTGGDV